MLLENVDRLVRSPLSNAEGLWYHPLLPQQSWLRRGMESINASEYGYPQKRRRTFIFATLVKSIVDKLYEGKNDDNVVVKNGFFPQEFPCKSNDDARKDAICLWPDLVKMTERFKFDFQNAGYMMNGRIFTMRVVPDVYLDRSSGKGTLGSILEKEVDERYYIPIDWIGDEKDRGSEGFRKTWRYYKGAKDETRQHRNGHVYRYTEGSIPFPDRLDEPSRTMLTSEGNRRPNRIAHIVPVDEEKNLYRVLTPIETERLNGFDDNWTEGMPERWRYFCMGNALVVGLIEQMGRRLKMLIQDSGLEQNFDSSAIRSCGGEIIGPLDLPWETSS